MKPPELVYYGAALKEDDVLPALEGSAESLEEPRSRGFARSVAGTDREVEATAFEDGYEATPISRRAGSRLKVWAGRPAKDLAGREDAFGPAPPSKAQGARGSTTWPAEE